MKVGGILPQRSEEEDGFSLVSAIVKLFRATDGYGSRRVFLPPKKAKARPVQSAGPGSKVQAAYAPCSEAVCVKPIKPNMDTNGLTLGCTLEFSAHYIWMGNSSVS